MLCKVKKGQKAFYGKGRNTRRLNPGEVFEHDGEKCPRFAEEVTGGATEKKAAKHAAGHLGQEPTSLSQMHAQGKHTVRELLPMIEAAKTLDDLEKLVLEDEDRKTVLDAYEKRKAELSEGTDVGEASSETEGTENEE